MKHSAIILAGGKSSRMNYVDKAFLDVYGMPMIKHVLNKFEGVDDIIIVTNKPEDYKQLGVRVVTDIIPQRGPLSGMHSGLVHAKHDYSFITACDTPLVPKEFIDYCFDLEKDYDVAVPYWNGFYEPTCGMYSKNVLPEIVKAIEAGIKMPIKIYPNLEVKTIEENVLSRFGDMRRMFTNINTAQELDMVNSNGDGYER